MDCTFPFPAELEADGDVAFVVLDEPSPPACDMTEAEDAAAADADDADAADRDAAAAADVEDIDAMMESAKVVSDK